MVQNEREFSHEAVSPNNRTSTHKKAKKCFQASYVQKRWQIPFNDVRNLGCSDNWAWSNIDRSPEARLYGDDNRVVHFHPNWSNGTAGIRGSCPLDGRRYYWEIDVSQRVFGTSIMFGVATEEARLHANSFTNLLGENSQGWGLSHKGLLWHGGKWSRYTSPFPENQGTTIGILFDGVAGTLRYYKDGEDLGVAFRDLHECSSKLYPFVCSTAAKTKMNLVRVRRDFINLQDRCRDVIAKRVVTKSRLRKLRLPPRLEKYVSQSLPMVVRIFRPAIRNALLDM